MCTCTCINVCNIQLHVVMYVDDIDPILAYVYKELRPQGPGLYYPVCTDMSNSNTCASGVVWSLRSIGP